MEASQSNAGVAACLIVPEVLKEDNYERWRIFVQHYLVAQDLWDVVLSNEMPHGEDPREWIKRNALALHAIKISCGAEKFDRIKEMNSPKDAWNALVDLPIQENEDENKEIGIETSTTVGRKQALTLLKDIMKKGDSDAVKILFETPSPRSAALENGFILLRVAITSGQLELAKKLISVMSEEDLETQDKLGKTALSLAACKGSKEIVECLVEKNKKLLEIPDCEKKIPVVLACATHHKSLTRYLYSVTPIEFLDPVNGDHGFLLLKEFLRNHMFDIGLELLHKFPDLTFHKSCLEPTPVILFLVEILPSLFAGNKLVLLGEELMYRFCQWLAYDLKYDRANARKLVRFICDEQVSSLETEQLMSSGAVEATFMAIKLDCLDFVKQITGSNPDIVWSLDPEYSRDMLMYAVAHRRREIAKFLYRLDRPRIMTECTKDDYQNNMLHLAAKLAPDGSGVDNFADPILRMQSEARWFTEVQRIVPKFYREEKNRDGETPSQVFSREHEGLLKEAQTWVKDTVNFAAVIGTLIIGVMFAAAITFPGGNNDRNGFPIFSDRRSFKAFCVSDLVSLYLASLSVMFFLNVHNSSLTVEDFRKSKLTRKLSSGFYLLFWSIGFMLFCSGASIFLVSQHNSNSSIYIDAVIVGLPFVYFFLKLLLPLLKVVLFKIF